MNSVLLQRLAIEEELYKKGHNVALYHIEHSEKFKQFESDVENTLFSIVKFIADNPDRIHTLLLFTKAANNDLVTQTGMMLGEKTLANGVDMAIYLQWVGEQGGQATMDRLGIDASFVLTNQELLNYFDDYSNLIITSVDDYTKQWIANQIQAGRDQHLSPQEIAQMLIDEGKAISAIRANRIAVTETAKALTTVSLEAARRYGILEKTWRTSLDDRVDDVCIGLEGKTVNINDNFPGGYDGPPAHILCRCYIDEVIPDGWEMPNDPWTGD